MDKVGSNTRWRKDRKGKDLDMKIRINIIKKNSLLNVSLK
jgi:hypothetical protein